MPRDNRDSPVYIPYGIPGESIHAGRMRLKAERQAFDEEQRRLQEMRQRLLMDTEEKTPFVDEQAQFMGQESPQGLTESISMRPSKFVQSLRDTGTPEPIVQYIQNNPYATKEDIEMSLRANMLSQKAQAQSQGRGEYYTPVYDSSGRLLSFNARSGEITQPQLPVVGAKYSPDLQGRLSASESHGKEIGKEASVAGKTGEASESISSALGILDKGIYAGTYGEAKKFAAKALPGDKQTVANTEEFIAHIGNVVIPRMRDLGGSDTEEELRYMRAITGGDLKMEPESIKRILISAERKIQAKQERLRREGKAVGLGEKIDASIPPKPQNVPTPKGVLTDEQRAALRKRHGL